MMVCRARHETNAETGLHGSRTSYTEYAFDRNALLLRACACVLRLTRVWRLITDYYNLYTIGVWLNGKSVWPKDRKAEVRVLLPHKRKRAALPTERPDNGLDRH